MKFLHSNPGAAGSKLKRWLFFASYIRGPGACIVFYYTCIILYYTILAYTYISYHITFKYTMSEYVILYSIISYDILHSIILCFTSFIRIKGSDLRLYAHYLWA